MLFRSLRRWFPGGKKQKRQKPCQQCTQNHHANSNELPEHADKYELHRLLSTLLSMELSVNEKLSIMENEYNIPVDDRIREDVCNLSQGILEKGEAKGEAKIIFKMYENKTMIAKKKPVLA